MGITLSADKTRITFDTYDSPADDGTYTVQIAIPQGTPNEALTCETRTVSIVLPLSTGAGLTDKTLTFKTSDINDGGTATAAEDAVAYGLPLNLLELLGPPADADFGDFREITTSGRPISANNNWSATGLAAGVYVFEYILPTTCDDGDDSNNPKATLTVVLTSACAKDPLLGVGLDTPVGISTISSDEAYLANKKGAYLALESNNKGLVITRMADPENTIPTANLVEGMAVYDTDDNCLKIYVVDANNASNTGWKCISQQTCNE